MAITLDTGSWANRILTLQTKLAGKGKTARLLNTLDKGAKFITWANPFIEKALTASREASLAWVAVGLVLPFISNLATANDENQKGFVYITSRLEYYVALEPEMRRSQEGISPALVKAAEAGILELYKAVLEFQVRTVVRLYEKRLKGIFKDAAKSDDWTALRSAVEKHEELVGRQFRQINGLVLSNGTRDSLRESIQHSKNLEEELSGIQNTLDQLLQLELEKQEEECLHSFLPSNSTDGSNTGYKLFMQQKGERVEGTCEWFLTHKIFQGWLARESPMLLCSADPGCGKSVLSRYLAETYLPGIESASICYFFFEEQVQERAAQALCALVHQFLCQNPSLIRKVPAVMKAKRDHGKNLATDLETLWDVFEKCLAHQETAPIIIILDALDECTKDDREFLIRKLRSLVKSWLQQPDLANAKFLITCRPYDDIMSRFEGLDHFDSLIHANGVRESAAISREVDLVIRAKIDDPDYLQLSRSASANERLRGLLREKMLNVSEKNRTYLWMHLTFEHLRSSGWSKTPSGLEQAIRVLPKNLTQAYEKILEKASENSQKSEVTRVLSVILAASEPLSVTEMNVALKEHENFSTIKDLEDDLESDEDFEAKIRTICGLFVSVHDGHFFLLHQTARTFLLEKTSQGKDHDDSSATISWQGSITLGDAHAVLAEICIGHLLLWDKVMGSFHVVDIYNLPVSRCNQQMMDHHFVGPMYGNPSSYDEMKRTHPRLLQFYAYCYKSWLYHVKDSSEAGDSRMVHRCVRFLNRKYDYPPYRFSVQTNKNPLSAAASHGLIHAFEAILESYRPQLASRLEREILEDIAETYKTAQIQFIDVLNSKVGGLRGWVQDPQLVDLFSGYRSLYGDASEKLHEALDGGADPDYCHFGGSSPRRQLINNRRWLYVAVLDFREKLGLHIRDWQQHRYRFGELRDYWDFKNMDWDCKKMDYEAYQLFFMVAQREIMMAEGRAPLKTYHVQPDDND